MHSIRRFVQFFILPVLASSLASAQNTWYVAESATGPGSGTSADPFSSIQYAIDQIATVSGDTIEVLPGIYSEGIDYSGKSLIVRAQMGSGVTTLQPGGQGTAVQVRNGEAVGTRLEGFKIEAGWPLTANTNLSGGVLLEDSHLTIVDCVIDSAVGGYAGGLFAENATLTITGCIVEDCLGWQAGGVFILDSTATLTGSIIKDNGITGISTVWPRRSPGLCGLNSSVTLSGCDFLRNNGQNVQAAALFEGCDAAFTNCSFSQNSNQGDSASLQAFQGVITLADCSFVSGDSYSAGHAFFWETETSVINTVFADGSGNVFGAGGAIFQGRGTGQYIGCRFMNCLAGANGGFTLSEGEAYFEDCLFQGNRAYYDPAPKLASALLVKDGGSAIAKQCRFTQNHATTIVAGVGATIYGPVQLFDCTIVDNLNDNGTACVREATLDHCIVWNNDIAALDSFCFSTWSDIQGGWPGVGNINQDPLLGADHIPLVGSPCIDTGDPNAPANADGSPRDIGARPFTWAEIGNLYCTAVPSSTGEQAKTHAFGQILAGSGPLFLVTKDLPANQFALFLTSQAQANMPLVGSGTLCLGAPFARFTQQVQNTGANGWVSIQVDTNAIPSPAAAQILPGSTWNFQTWFRDSQGQPRTGLSLPTSVTFP